MDTKIENQINAEQISLQIIMRLRQIMQEMSKHSKLILEKYNIFDTTAHLSQRSIPTRTDINRCINKDRFFK